MVVEKTDYLTGRNVRYLRVDTPDLPSSQVGGEDGGAGGGGGGGAGTPAGACTPPPRENGEGPFGNGNANTGGSGSGGPGGSGGGGGGSAVGRNQPQNGLGGWAPPSNTLISPERLFGDVTASSSAPAVAAGSNGN